MNIHDCGAPISRQMIKIDRAWFLELENTSAETLSELHIGEVPFREDWADGKPTIRIAFENVPSLAPKTRVVLRHKTLLFDEYNNAWKEADAFNDGLILLNEESAKKPIVLTVEFVMNDQHCYQELTAGQGSGLSLFD